MAKLTSSHIYMILIFLLGVGVGAGAYYGIDKAQGPKLKYSQVKIQKTNGSMSEADVNTISTNEVVSNVNKYSGKNIQVVGNVIETSPGNYVLGYQKIQNYGVVPLDFSKSKLDPKSYLGENRVVIISGKLVVNDKAFKLEVTSAH